MTLFLFNISFRVFNNEHNSYRYPEYNSPSPAVVRYSLLQSINTTSGHLITHTVTLSTTPLSCSWVILFTSVYKHYIWSSYNSYRYPEYNSPSPAVVRYSLLQSINTTSGHLMSFGRYSVYSIAFVRCDVINKKSYKY
jgi:hypothetical protein